MAISDRLHPGKYDDLCTEVREKSHGTGAVVIVFGGTGDKGPGFSMQAPLDEMIKLPSLLRYMATEIEKDLSPIKTEP